MAKNYASGMPVGNNQMPVGALTPAPFKAINAYADENGLLSSVITLTQNTTVIELAAQSSPVIMKWVAQGDLEASVFATASTASYDHMIPANTVRRLVVPIETNPATGYSSMQGANRENGLYRRVAYGTTVVASVFLSEYGSSNSY